MDRSPPTVLIVESNGVRAAIHERWLGGYDVRTALTDRQVDAELDESVSIAVLSEAFGDDPAAVRERIEDRAPDCTVATMGADPEQAFPQLSVDHFLAAPVTEADLRGLVDRLAHRNRFGELLVAYYRLTAQLTSEEVKEATGEGASESRGPLERRVANLQSELTELRQYLDIDDVHAVVDSLMDDADDPERAEEGESKYAPSACPNCGRQWGVGTGDDSSLGYKKLGSFVWRCVDCGHVQMQTSASHRRLAPYR